MDLFELCCLNEIPFMNGTVTADQMHISEQCHQSCICLLVAVLFSGYLQFASSLYCISGGLTVVVDFRVTSD